MDWAEWVLGVLFTIAMTVISWLQRSFAKALDDVSNRQKALDDELTAHKSEYFQYRSACQLRQQERNATMKEELKDILSNIDKRLTVIEQNVSRITREDGNG